MKYYGDIPEEHLMLVEELEALESWFYKHGDGIPTLSASKGMVCIAYDYYSMDMEEEGERFIRAAEKYSPGYFTGPIICHVERDSFFSELVDRLKRTEALELMVSLGFGK